MSNKWAPQDWLGAGYSLASNAISLTTADKDGDKALPEVTDAEAHATTGDIRKVLFGLMEAIFNAWNGTAAADRPTRMTVQKSAFTDVNTGLVEKTYTMRFTTEAEAYEVVDEPVEE